MPRVYTTKSARPSKFTRTCITCGAVVQPGESYQYAEPRIGPKLHWCFRHHPKRSQLSTSRLGPLWDAIDEFDPQIFSTLEDLKARVEEIISIANDIQGEYEDSLQNMPTQEGPVPEAMQENINFLQAYATDLENIDWDSKEPNEDARAEVEMMIVREMLDEREIDYEDSQLSDPIRRSSLIEEHLDYSVFETQVNERIDASGNGSIEEAQSEVEEIVASFEG